jgi:hypothetical protein
MSGPSGASIYGVDVEFGAVTERSKRIEFGPGLSGTGSGWADGSFGGTRRGFESHPATACSNRPSRLLYSAVLATLRLGFQ